MVGGVVGLVPESWRAIMSIKHWRCSLNTAAAKKASCPSHPVSWHGQEGYHDIDFPCLRDKLNVT